MKKKILEDKSNKSLLTFYKRNSSIKVLKNENFKEQLQSQPKQVKSRKDLTIKTKNTINESKNTTLNSVKSNQNNIANKAVSNAVNDMNINQCYNSNKSSNNYEASFSSTNKKQFHNRCKSSIENVNGNGHNKIQIK